MGLIRFEVIDASMRILVVVSPDGLCDGANCTSVVVKAVRKAKILFEDAVNPFRHCVLALFCLRHTDPDIVVEQHIDIWIGAVLASLI